MIYFAYQTIVHYRESIMTYIVMCELCCRSHHSAMRRTFIARLCGWDEDHISHFVPSPCHERRLLTEAIYHYAILRQRSWRKELPAPLSPLRCRVVCNRTAPHSSCLFFTLTSVIITMMMMFAANHYVPSATSWKCTQKLVDEKPMEQNEEN